MNLDKFVWGVNDVVVLPSVLGGAGSGNFNHSGRPGEIGGSAPNKHEVTELEDAMVDEAGIRNREDLNTATMDDRTYMKSRVVKDLTRRIERMPAAETYHDVDLRTVVQKNIDNWAITSGDSLQSAVRMQRAAAEEFELNSAELSHLMNPKAFWGEDSPVKTVTKEEWSADTIPTALDKAFVHAEYDATQQWLKDKGMEYVTVFRGQHSTPLEAGEQTVTMQPVSSWTTSLDTAMEFTMTKDNSGQDLVTKRVLVARVPRERVLSTSVTGRGVLPESEVLLLGGPLKANIWALKDKYSWENMKATQRRIEAFLGDKEQQKLVKALD